MHARTHTHTIILYHLVSFGVIQCIKKNSRVYATTSNDATMAMGGTAANFQKSLNLFGQHQYFTILDKVFIFIWNYKKAIIMQSATNHAKRQP